VKEYRCKNMEKCSFPLFEPCKVMLPLRSDIDLMKADDNDNDNNDVLERKG
jgi:hypothetical protein